MKPRAARCFVRICFVKRTAWFCLPLFVLFGRGHAQAPVITAPANGAVIPTTGTAVQIAANPANNFTIIYLVELATGLVVWQSGYLYGTGAISQPLPPGLRPAANYRIAANSHDNASVVRSAVADVVTDNVPTPSPYPVIAAPNHGRPVPQTGVTVQLAGNPYNHFTVVETIDLTTNTFLDQSPFLGFSGIAAPLAYTLPLTFDPAHTYRIQARNYANIGGLYQTEITVNAPLPVAKVHTPAANATLPGLDYAFEADPVNAGTPPTQYVWRVEPTGAFTPAQQPMTRFGKTLRLADYLIAGRTYRTQVTGLMNGETAAPASSWNDFSVAATAKPDTAAFQGKTDYLFRYLDKSQILTQILYDRVFPLGRLDMFNQQGRSDTSSYNHFLQVYNELFDANYNSQNNMLPPEILESLSFQKSLNNVVPIGVLNYNFNVIDTNAITDNLLSASSGFYQDVTNRPRSPYLNRNVVVVSALTKNVRAGNVGFSLPAELLMGNKTQAVTSIQVRGGDANQTITLTPNGAATLTYAQAGRKVLRFIVTFNDSATQTTYALLNVFN